MRKLKKAILVASLSMVVIIVCSVGSALLGGNRDYDKSKDLGLKSAIIESTIKTEEKVEEPKETEKIQDLEAKSNIDYMNYEEKVTFKTPVVLSDDLDTGLEAMYYFKDAPSTYIKDDFENNLKTWGTFYLNEGNNYVDNTIEPYVEKYLKAKNTYKDKPDKVFYDNDRVLAECYINEELGLVSFIVNVDGNEDKLCTTYDMSVYEEKGFVEYKENADGYTTSEILYDTEKNKIDELEYSYKKDIPFTFIKSQSNPEVYEEWYMVIPKTLRWDKFWFYEDSAKYNEKGEITLYESKVHYPQKEQGGYEYAVEYENNKLSKIKNLHTEKSEIYDREFEDYIECSYENGKIDRVEYARTGEGTSDSTGNLYYDDYGRIIRNGFYYTSGSGRNYYLYDGDSRRPTAIISIYGMAQSGGSIKSMDYVLIGSEMFLYNEIEK